ncbi:metalloregulator ArsR/SmtB family transcription factor [Kordiimonas sp.]|uniref:metalloregulator ArsR/SmtB family transcription factor n=1 Tax=Kordiimonas sp. TaxID=1970157 RepID=UPI003A926A1D
MTHKATAEVVRAHAVEVAALMKTLSHPNRLLIACELMQGERSVSEIEEATGVRQPVLSRELARLRDEELVATRRESKAVFYRLENERLRLLMKVLCQSWGGPGVDTPEGGEKGALPEVLPEVEGRPGTRLRLKPDPYRAE